MSEKDHWAVSVAINGDNVLTIESGCLSGIPNIDDHADIVRECAEHLLSFIGEPSWRPVETAPHNEEVLLLTEAIQGVVTREKPKIEVGCYSWGNDHHGRSMHGCATYWKPLPSPYRNTFLDGLSFDPSPPPSPVKDETAVSTSISNSAAIERAE